jgi:hypothetical protein
MKYEDRELKIGELVRILNPKGKDRIAYYDGVEDIYIEGIKKPFIKNNPRFKYKSNGKKTYGFKCWWIPEREALIAEEMLKK